jgi:hypothetical protein
MSDGLLHAMRPTKLTPFAWYRQCQTCGYPWYLHQVNHPAPGAHPICNTFSFPKENEVTPAELQAFLPTEPPTAQRIARYLGDEDVALRWLVPSLNQLRAEGKTVRESLDESGLCGWRLP